MYRSITYVLVASAVTAGVASHHTASVIETVLATGSGKTWVKHAGCKLKVFLTELRSVVAPTEIVEIAARPEIKLTKQRAWLPALPRE